MSRRTRRWPAAAAGGCATHAVADPARSCFSTSVRRKCSSVIGNGSRPSTPPRSPVAPRARRRSDTNDEMAILAMGRRPLYAGLKANSRRESGDRREPRLVGERVDAAAATDRVGLGQREPCDRLNIGRELLEQSIETAGPPKTTSARRGSVRPAVVHTPGGFVATDVSPFLRALTCNQMVTYCRGRGHRVQSPGRPDAAEAARRTLP